MPENAREALEWLCREKSDVGLGRVLLRLRRGEWRDKLDTLERMVGKEVWYALQDLGYACRRPLRSRGEAVVSLEELRTPRLNDARASLHFLASLGCRKEWADSWDRFVSAQEHQGFVARSAVEVLKSRISSWGYILSIPAELQQQAAFQFLRTQPQLPSTLLPNALLKTVLDELSVFNTNSE